MLFGLGDFGNPKRLMSTMLWVLTHDRGGGGFVTGSKDRLEKNRDKLFTFLSFDGVPWNNNNAEHAVKPVAALRQIIGGITTENGIRDYLVLLSLCETCKYMGVDFLDFLRSGEKDIHAFAESRRSRRKPSPTSVKPVRP